MTDMKRLIIILALCVAVTARAEEASKPTIFVARLDGDMAQIQGWQPALGEGLAEMLITELGKLGKFDVLESTALPELQSEIKLGQEGYVGEGEKVEKGGYAGADFMFRGKVTRFGSQQKGLNLGGFAPGGIGNLGVHQTKSDVRIDWRIVDVYTRKVLKTGEAVGTQTGGGFNIGVGVNGNGGNIGFGNQEFMNSALGRATVLALSNILNEVAMTTLPESGRHKAQAGKQAQQSAQEQAAQQAARNTAGKVLAVPSKGVVIVSLGSKQGFKSGDKLALYQTVDTKDDKGAVVFTDEKLVGEITLDAVQEDRSKASYTDDLEVKSGWVVKAR
jgi:curli biogenesis system outer membrane secretion channel CsgG